MNWNEKRPAIATSPQQLVAEPKVLDRE